MTSPTPVVFIHGLFVHGSSWQNWVEAFGSRGYAPIAPDWPQDRPDVAGTRANAAEQAGQGAAEIARHYTEIIRGLPSAPIVVGHSFGGLVAQKLLADGVAAAAVAIDPGQIKGVLGLPPAQLRVGLPVLSRPGNRRRAVALSAAQFRYGFGNALPAAESDELFERWAIPGPGRVPFQLAFANLVRNSPLAVDTGRSDRGPLLLIGGGQDHSVPVGLVRATHRRYSGSRAVTDLKVFPDRGHSLVFDHGWREVADHVLEWLSRQHL